MSYHIAHNRKERVLKLNRHLYVKTITDRFDEHASGGNRQCTLIANGSREGGIAGYLIPGSSAGTHTGVDYDAPRYRRYCSHFGEVLL